MSKFICLLCNNEIEQERDVCNKCRELEKAIPQCAICGKKIPEVEMLCDECWEKEKKDYKKGIFRRRI